MPSITVEKPDRMCKSHWEKCGDTKYNYCDMLLNL